MLRKQLNQYAVNTQLIQKMKSKEAAHIQGEISRSNVLYIKYQTNEKTIHNTNLHGCVGNTVNS